MQRILVILLTIGIFASCRSTRKITTAITKKDTSVVKINDTVQMIQAALQGLSANRIQYQTFSSKINVDYRGSDGKHQDVNANVRMYRDSALWISVTGALGIEGMRVLITRDSVKMLNKLEKTYTARSVDYLQEVTALPLDLPTVQNLIIGNPVFLDSNIVSYSSGNNVVALLSVGQWFKNLLTLGEADKTLLNSKLDDADITRNRTANLAYSDYENKKGVPFATKRSITVAEKTKLDIKLDFKQYDFNGEISMPFSVPKNYDRL